MNESFLLLTLGPGLSESAEGSIAIVRYPGFTVVDRLTRKNPVYDQTHKGICGASLLEGNSGADLVACSEAEVFLAKLAPLQNLDGKTLKRYNDVHHVAYGGGEFAVANAGCDTIEILDHRLELKRTVPLIRLFRPPLSFLSSILGEEIKRIYKRLRGQGASYGHFEQKKYFVNVKKYLQRHRSADPNQEMRFTDFRPHFLHPNFVEYHDGEWFATLFRPGIQIGLTTGKTRVSGLNRPHDGTQIEGQTYFTESATSVLSVRSSETPQKVAQSFEIIPDGKIGFLRGIAAINGLLFTGLTARRGRGFVDFARLAVVRASDGQIVDCWQVPKELGCQIYSVLDVTKYYTS
jgi:hypothetical protein